MYFDVERDHVHSLPASAQKFSSYGYALVWYLLPQDAKLAFKLYMALVSDMKLRDLETELDEHYINARFLILPYVCSKEFGDSVVTHRLHRELSRVSEGKKFGEAEFDVVCCYTIRQRRVDIIPCT